MFKIDKLIEKIENENHEEINKITSISGLISKDKDALFNVYSFDKENIGKYVKDGALTEKALELINKIYFHKEYFLEFIGLLQENEVIKIEIRSRNYNDEFKTYVMVHGHSKENITYIQEFVYENEKMNSDNLFYFFLLEEEVNKEQKEEILLDLEKIFKYAIKKENKTDKFIEEKMKELRRKILKEKMTVRLYEIFSLEKNEIGCRIESFFDNKIQEWIDIFKESENSIRVLSKITGEERIIDEELYKIAMNFFEFEEPNPIEFINKQISKKNIGEVTSKLTSSPTVIGYAALLGIEFLQGFLGIEDNFITKTVKGIGMGLVEIDYLTDYQLSKSTTKTITSYEAIEFTNSDLVDWEEFIKTLK